MLRRVGILKTAVTFVALCFGLQQCIWAQSPEAVFKKIGDAVNNGRWDKVFSHCTKNAQHQFVFEMLSHYRHMNDNFSDIDGFKATRAEIRELLKKFRIEKLDIYVEIKKDPETRREFEKFARQREIKLDAILGKMGMRKYDFLRKLSFSLSNTDYGRCSMSLGVARLSQVEVDGNKATGTLDEWFTKVSKTMPSLYYPERPVRFVKLDGKWKFDAVDQFAFYNSLHADDGK